MIHLLWYALSRAALIVGVLAFAVQILWSFVRRHAINTTTVLHELPRLGQHHTSGRVNGNVIIAGGSVAGLATAIVCSKFFDRVIVIEPDSMAELKRTRVAQAEQLHGIQAISLPILRGLIPDFDTRVLKHGGRILECNGQLQVGPTRLNFSPGSLPDSIFISRLSLEQLLREYVQNIPVVQVIQGLVTGVAPDSTGERIERVTVQTKRAGAENIELDAAMFVDCTGPATVGSRLLEKVQGTKWGPYPKTWYDPKISYATARVRVPDQLKDMLPIFTRQLEEYSTFEKLSFLRSVLPYPEQDNRMVCMIRTDESHITCGIGGWDLPADSRPRSFSEYIQQVDSVWQSATDTEALEDDPSRTAVMDSLRQIEALLKGDESDPEFRFCKMGPCYKIDYTSAPKPSNFVAIGDSLLRVNPAFGQGISKALIDVASLNGAILDTTLVPNPLVESKQQSLPATFSAEMLARQIPRVMHLWVSTKDSDYGRKGTDLVAGESSELGLFGRKYWRGIVHVASKDQSAAVDVVRSLHLVAPPLDLLRPSLFIRAMWNTMRESQELR